MREKAQLAFALIMTAAAWVGVAVAWVDDEPKHETDWSAQIATGLGGKAEYRTADGTRVDILTETHAIEVEWIDKYKEALTQAIEYAQKTNRKPGIIFLLRGSQESRKRYIARSLIAVAYVRGLGGDVWVEFRETE